MADTPKQQFDLRSQQGVADLLHQVRSSALPATTKTTIRELVLKYTQRGGDAGVREELEEMLSGMSFSVAESTPATNQATSPQTQEDTAPEPAQSAKTEKKQHGFSGSRPIPSFAPVTAGVGAPAADATPDPQPTPEPAPAVKPPAPPQPTPEPAPAVKPPAPPAPTPEPAQQPPAAPTPEPAAPAPVTTQAPGDHMARVQEIKREVIGLVGNPVNLVDINNEVGKQYMTALLDAMKRINGGTKAQVTEAMQNLETAFVAVQKVAEGHQVQTPTPEPAQQPPAVPTPAPSTQKVVVQDHV